MGNRNNDIGRELDLKIEIIHNYIQEGFTVGQIAEMIGYGYAGLYNAIKRSKYRDAISIKNNGKSIKSILDQKRRRKLNDSEVLAAHESYVSGKDLKEVSSEYNITASGLYHIFMRNGLSVRSKSDAMKLLYEKKLN